MNYKKYIIPILVIVIVMLASGLGGVSSPHIILLYACIILLTISNANLIKNKNIVIDSAPYPDYRRSRQ